MYDQKSLLITLNIFQSHFSPFQFNIQLMYVKMSFIMLCLILHNIFCFEILNKMTGDRLDKWKSFWLSQITFHSYLWNGLRWSFCMSEYFDSIFILNYFTKQPLAAILNQQKSFLMAYFLLVPLSNVLHILYKWMQAYILSNSCQKQQGLSSLVDCKIMDT